MPDKDHHGQAEGKEKIAIARKKGLSLVGDPKSGLSVVDHWEAVMRRFHEAHKVTCKSAPSKLQAPRCVKTDFPTDSSYEGTWNVLGISGQGKYTFPYKDTAFNGLERGVVYEGQFEDGLFNGEGELQYECGVNVKGKFKKGEITEKKVMFIDGLEYDENWQYCNMPDRRFTIEYENGIKPAGVSHLTALEETKMIPPGYYDSGDGFFDPRTKSVYKYSDLTAIVRAPSKVERRWIMENCRTNPAESLGPCPFLYEDFLDPMTEAEDPPPPSSHTKNYQEEILEREVYFSSGAHGHRSSRSQSTALFPGLNISRRVTEFDPCGTDFYKPDYYLDSRPSTASCASRLSMGSRMSTTMKFSRRFEGISFDAPSMFNIPSRLQFSNRSYSMSDTCRQGKSTSMFEVGKFIATPTTERGVGSVSGLVERGQKKLINW